jgi:hypothetical protein
MEPSLLPSCDCNARYLHYVSGWLEIFGSVIGGGVCGTGGSAWIGSRERKKERKAETRRSYAAYLGAFYQAVSIIREVPEIPPAGPNSKAEEWLRAKLAEPSSPSWATSAVKHIDAAAWVRTQERLQRVTGGRLHDTSAQVVTAGAFLQVLPLPDDARAAVERANEYLIRLGSDRSPERLADYAGIYAGLRAAGKQMEGW